MKTLRLQDFQLSCILSPLCGKLDKLYIAVNGQLKTSQAALCVFPEVSIAGQTPAPFLVAFVLELGTQLHRVLSLSCLLNFVHSPVGC